MVEECHLSSQLLKRFSQESRISVDRSGSGLLLAVCTLAWWMISKSRGGVAAITWRASVAAVLYAEVMPSNALRCMVPNLFRMSTLEAARNQNFAQYAILGMKTALYILVKCSYFWPQSKPKVPLSLEKRSKFFSDSFKACVLKVPFVSSYRPRYFRAGCGVTLTTPNFILNLFILPFENIAVVFAGENAFPRLFPQLIFCS